MGVGEIPRVGQQNESGGRQRWDPRGTHNEKPGCGGREAAVTQVHRKFGERERGGGHQFPKLYKRSRKEGVVNRFKCWGEESKGLQGTPFIGN